MKSRWIGFGHIVRRVNRRKRITLAVFVFAVLVTLATGTGIWAAPASQGTVPPPPARTAVPLPPLAPPSSGGGSTSSVVPSPSPTVMGPTPTPVGVPVAGAVVCIVGGGATCVSDGPGDLVLTVDLQAVPLGSLAILNRIAAPPAGLVDPAATGAYRFLGHLYQLSIVGPDGSPIPGPFDPPLDLWITYSGADLAEARGNADALVILRYDELSTQWSTLGVSNRTVDPSHQQIHVSASRLGWFGMFTPTQAAPAGTPVATAGPATNTAPTATPKPSPTLEAATYSTPTLDDQGSPSGSVMSPTAALDAPQLAP